MSRPKHCVLIVRTPDGWKPQRFHSIPPTIVSAEFYARNLTLPEAIGAARAFNKSHLQPAAFKGEWALCVKALRANKSNMNRQQRNGGAA